jgi:acetylglutamate kinase
VVKTPAQATDRIVLKLGGRALEAPGALEQLAAEMAKLPGGCVIVHGGGAEVTDWCTKLGVAPKFLDGLRVTDPATLEIAVAVLAGLANKRLVALLRAASVDAVGLSALDGGLAEVMEHTEAARLGAVGRLIGIRPRLLEILVADGRTPVLASIGATNGQLLNLNADDLAAGVAGVLRARALLLLSDTPGVKLGGTVLEQIQPGEVAGLLAHPDVRDGMRPKLRAAAAAIEGGTRRVVFGAWTGPGTLASLLAGEGGTTLSARALEGSRG